MATAAKRYSELTQAERAAVTKAPQRPDPTADRQPNAHMLLSDVAATIKGWTPAEMQLFADKFGISIVHQATKHAKKCRGHDSGGKAGVHRSARLAEHGDRERPERRTIMTTHTVFASDGMTTVMTPVPPAPRAAAETPNALLLMATRARARLATRTLQQPADDAMKAVQTLAVQHSRTCSDGWTGAQASRVAMDAREAILQTMQEKVALLTGVAAITESDAARIASVFEIPPRAPTEAQREIIKGYPALSAWHAAREAQLAEADRRAAEDIVRACAERNAAQAAAAAAERAAIVPALVRRLASNGITLTASTKGISARPAELLTDGERALIREHRDELTKLLQSSEVVA